ncbi:hypothetical protein ACFO3O_21985 [Dokdonia ponticola]|uniref:Transposase n=1 Tax=Dokdonia ponticola TaxID=2041041 RepID=A0ABV9I5L9_9FLAO
MSEVTFYNWKKKYAGLGVSDLNRLKNLRRIIDSSRNW